MDGAGNAHRIKISGCDFEYMHWIKIHWPSAGTIVFIEMKQEKSRNIRDTNTTSYFSFESVY